MGLANFQIKQAQENKWWWWRRAAGQEKGEGGDGGGGGGKDSQELRAQGCSFCTQDAWNPFHGPCFEGVTQQNRNDEELETHVCPAEDKNPATQRSGSGSHGPPEAREAPEGSCWKL